MNRFDINSLNNDNSLLDMASLLLELGADVNALREGYRTVLGNGFRLSAVNRISP